MNETGRSSRALDVKAIGEPALPLHLDPRTAIEIERQPTESHCCSAREPIDADEIVGGTRLPPIGVELFPRDDRNRADGAEVAVRGEVVGERGGVGEREDGGDDLVGR